MPVLDIVLLVVAGLSALMGLSRGFFKEVLSLGTWLVAFFLALYFSPRVAESVELIPGGGQAERVVAFALIFVSTLILGALVQFLVAKLVESTGLSGTDRLLGMVFGAARGAIICIVALIALRPFVEDTGWWNESRLQSELLAFEGDVLDLLGQARGAVGEAADRLSDQP